MKKLMLLILLLAVGLIVTGCSDDDDNVTVPPTELHEAHADISNFLVGDGTTDTRLNVRMSSSVEVTTGVEPNQTDLDATLLLGSASQTSPVEMLLSYGDGTVLNDGQEFGLVEGRRYLFMAIGHVEVTSGITKPTLLQLNPMAKPGVGRVHFRFIHALAGNPVAVDVHVNDEVITNVAYGQAGTPVTFDARPVGQDDLRVVPTGVVPDGTNEIYMSTGQLLFTMDEHYDGVLGHHPQSIHDGDVNGNTAMILIQSPY